MAEKERIARDPPRNVMSNVVRRTRSSRDISVIGASIA
jgi:hypothetical protein